MSQDKAKNTFNFNTKLTHTKNLQQIFIYFFILNINMKKKIQKKKYYVVI